MQGVEIPIFRGWQGDLETFLKIRLFLRIQKLYKSDFENADLSTLGRILAFASYRLSDWAFVTRTLILK